MEGSKWNPHREMNIDNHYYQSNRQIAFTHIIYLAHNYFSNCHQLPLWRITRDYSCPIETLISNPPSALPDVNLKNTNQKNHDPQLGLLHTTINLVILNLSRSNVLKTPPPTQRDRDRSDKKKSAGPPPQTPPRTLWCSSQPLTSSFKNLLHPSRFNSTCKDNPLLSTPPDRNGRTWINSPHHTGIREDELRRNLNPQQSVVWLRTGIMPKD